MDKKVLLQHRLLYQGLSISATPPHLVRITYSGLLCLALLVITFTKPPRPSTPPLLLVHLLALSATPSLPHSKTQRQESLLTSSKGYQFQKIHSLALA